MASDRSMKDKAMAAHLKKMGVKRTTGMCPMGCGRAVTIGGPALIAHLGRCNGAHRKDGRKRR